MKDIIKSLQDLLKGLGIENEFINSAMLGLLISSVLLSVAAALWKLFNNAVAARNRRLLNKNLNPYFTRQDVQRATKYFIPTRYQNVSPSEDDEPGKLYIAAAQAKLIPLFLKTVFRDAAESNKYYLVLADTGMGKTTFLINLYLKYKNQWKLFPGFTPSYDIALFPLGDPDVLDAIEKIQNKRNTILLLDAFDEDVEALDNHKARMHKILTRLREFHTIVITCRTQFFPSEDEEPHKAGVFGFGEDGEYWFQKLYLSVFDNSDVKRYLRLRFSLFSLSKYFKAKEIVKKCPNLVVRPMLLSRINDLLDSAEPFDYSFQIYKVMIDKWIERESNKPGILQREDPDKYPQMLYQFSKALAVDLYINKDVRGGYLISKDENIALHSQIQIADIEHEYKNLSLTEKEARSQSLLNRNSKGQYKFSHKSFLEYFLANELVDNGDLYSNFDFEGMSAARTFFHEMLVDKISRCEGYYVVPFDADDPAIPGSDHFNGTVRHLSHLKDVNEIGKICKIKITNLDTFNIPTLSEFTNLRSLTIRDKALFANLYDMYRRYKIVISSLLDYEETKAQISVVEERLSEWMQMLILAETRGWTALAWKLAPVVYFLLFREFDRRGLTNEEVESRYGPSGVKVANWVREQKRFDVFGLGEYEQKLRLQQYSGSMSVLEWVKESNHKEITRINRFLTEMNALQKKLPNCRMYY
jgi:hypothetical protein